MVTLIIDTCPYKNSLWQNEFIIPITDIIKNNFKIIHYTKLTEDIVNKFDKIIISGTALKDNEYLNHLNEFNWIKTTNTPILGICSGAQIITKTFNSELIKSQEIGLTKIKTIKQNKLFENELEVYELHNLAITCPKEFEILAKSAKCVQAIKHNQKEIYGLLFHPEVRNKEMIKKFIEL